MTAPKVVFCGIFFNEAASIIRSLDSVKPVIDCVALVDTGSTDGTPDLVRKWMADNKVPGVVYSCTWPEYAAAKGIPPRANGQPPLFDFAAMRNLAQSLAQQHVADAGPSGWLLEFDGDWTLEGKTHQLRAVLEQTPPECTAFNLDVRQPGTSLPYLRLRRAVECGPSTPRGRPGWLWRFPIHEALWRPDDAQVGSLEGVHIWHEAPPTEKRAWRWERDLEVFAEWLEIERAKPESDQATLGRIQFYLAQTYDCLDRYPEALAAYLERDKLGGVAWEWAVALFRAGRVEYRLVTAQYGDVGTSLYMLRDAKAMWIKAHAVGGRPEPLWAIAEMLGKHGPEQADEARYWAQLAYACAQRMVATGAPVGAEQYSDPRAYSLARGGPPRDTTELDARLLHLKLLTGG